MLLPLHTKSKSINFIDSPKLWMRNFFTYLKKNHPRIYLSIKNSFSLLKYFLSLLATILVSYQFGAFVLNEISEPDNIIYKEPITYNIVSLIFGFALLYLIAISFVIIYCLIYYAKWFIFYYLFEKIKDFYFGVLDIFIALRLYKNYKDELDKSNLDPDV